MFYSSPHGSWNGKIVLYNYDVTPYRRVEAGLQGLWFFALIGIAIAAVSSRRPRNEVFQVHKIWLALVPAIISYAFTFANQLVKEHGSVITYSYLLAVVIFVNLVYLAEIALLAIIFTVLFRLYQQPDARSQKHKMLLYLHYAYCCILFVFYLTIFGLEVRVLSNQVNGHPQQIMIHGRLASRVFDVIYCVFYAAASFEIFIGSITALTKYRQYSGNRSIALLFFTMIAFPTLINRFYTLSYNLRIELYLEDSILAGESIAAIVIGGLGTFLAFAGLIAISRQPSGSDFPRTDLESRTYQQGRGAPSHVVPNGDMYTVSQTQSEVESEPYSHDYANNKEYSPMIPKQSRLGEMRDGITNWRPSFRKGGKSSLGLKLAL
ncbi:hypothetical protein ACLMJK_008550 [Lecanora helva]